MRRFLSGASLGAFLHLAASSGALAADPFEPRFDGVWAGSLRLIDPTTHNPPVWDDAVKLPESLDFRIEIRGDEINVFLEGDGGWQAVKPGAFAKLVHKTNAVIAAIDSYIQSDYSSGWVETWNFTLTHKENDSLYAYWVRSVNNYSMPAESDPSARFFMSRFGELRRSNQLLVQQRIPASNAAPSIVCLKSDIVCGGAPPPLRRSGE